MMCKKPILRVSILYDAPLDSELSKRLLQYFKPYEFSIRIDISEARNIRKVIWIPPASYAPIFNTEFTYPVKTQDQLYNIVIKLIHLAVKYINQTGYHSTGDTLRILIPSTPNDDSSYTFGWGLNTNF